MRGARTDTFGRHPDYAEVGRLVSIARILDHQVTAQVDDASRAAHGTLTW
jgi:hypothetical protein